MCYPEGQALQLKNLCYYPKSAKSNGATMTHYFLLARWRPLLVMEM